MKLTLFESTLYVHRTDPVEFVVAVDGKTIRVAVEWSVVERLMGTSSATEDQVRDFLRRFRVEIRLALEAHLFARGVPHSGYLVMSQQDFDAPHSTAGPASEPASKEPHMSGD